MKKFIVMKDEPKADIKKVNLNPANVSLINKTEIDISQLLLKNIHEYAIDVAEDRALASFRDGMKPSQRRLLKALIDDNAFNNRSTLKSAKVVGDTMGKYHPHGPDGLYGALTTLVNSQYPIVFGQGNWGNLTDPPAASRYTECKLSALGMKFIECSEVAEMIPNYSGEYLEPIDFPTRVPNFFLNGCNGIAVGIACSIPEHNLDEVVSALKTVIKKGAKTTTDDILKHIKGPEYKYGGKLLSTPDEIKQVYDIGHGSLRYECNYDIIKKGSNTILIITGYCPGFAPDSFQDRMIKLIETGDVVYTNDSSTKEEPCKLEVVIKNFDVFEESIKKHLQKTIKYQFYALDRTKSDSIESDVNTKIFSPNMINLMKMWIDYRRIIETKMIDLELNKLTETEYKHKCRLAAVENLDIIKRSLEDNNPEKYIAKNIKLLQTTPKCNTIVGVDYILELRLSSIRKIDAVKIKNELIKIGNNKKELTKDRANIDLVIIKHLDELKRYSTPRILKI